MYLDKYLKAKGSDEQNSCFLNAQMKFAQGLFPETITAADACINAGGTVYPNLYGLKAYAHYKIGETKMKAADSVSAMTSFGNAKTSFETYFQKQKPAKIGPRDYETLSKVLLMFPGNEALATTYLEKAIEMDTTEAAKVAKLSSVAKTLEAQKKYFDAANLYKRIVYLKKAPGKTDVYNAGIGYYRDGYYPAAIEMFNVYQQKFPDDIFGYYYKGAAQAGIDTSMVTDSAYNTYQKAVTVGEAYPDKARIMTLIKGSYRYLVLYAANKLKNKELALSYVDKALLLDPADAEFIGFKEAISKMGTKPAAPPKPPKPGGTKTPVPKKKK
jgi:tetratricopeptide (TPR) repeat protein